MDQFNDIGIDASPGAIMPEKVVRGRGRPRASYGRTGELDISLIREYRARPALYDRNSKRFKDKMYGAQQWQIISHKLGFDVSLLKDRMIQLRNRYNIEKRRLDQAREEHNDDNIESAWPLYDTLDFLSEHIRSRRSFRHLGKQETSASGDGGDYEENSDDNLNLMQYDETMMEPENVNFHGVEAIADILETKQSAGGGNKSKEDDAATTTNTLIPAADVKIEMDSGSEDNADDENEVERVVCNDAEKQLPAAALHKATGKSVPQQTLAISNVSHGAAANIPIISHYATRKATGATERNAAAAAAAAAAANKNQEAMKLLPPSITLRRLEGGPTGGPSKYSVTLSPQQQQQQHHQQKQQQQQQQQQQLPIITVLSKEQASMMGPMQQQKQQQNGVENNISATSLTTTTTTTNTQPITTRRKAVDYDDDDDDAVIISSQQQRQQQQQHVGPPPAKRSNISLEKNPYTIHMQQAATPTQCKYRAFGEFVSSSLLDLSDKKALHLVEKFTSELVQAMLQHNMEKDAVAAADKSKVSLSNGLSGLH